MAKVHKIVERLGDRDRAQDKDSLDVFRLLQAVSSAELARRLETLLDNDTAGAVTAEAIERVPVLFGGADADGIEMAARATAVGEDPATIASSFVALVDELREEIEQ